MKVSSKTVLKIIFGIVLSFFVFPGIIATFGNTQQMLSISIFLLLVYCLLVIATIASDSATKRTCTIASLVLLFMMGALSTDIGESAQVTQNAIIAIGFYLVFQILLVHRSNTKAKSPYEKSKSISDSYNRKD